MDKGVYSIPTSHLKWWERVLLLFIKSQYSIAVEYGNDKQHVMKYKVLNKKIYILSMKEK